MAFVLSKTSKARLVGVDEDLVRVVYRALEISKRDFMVLEGLRTLQRQKELYAQGRTTPGKIVTWTMQSKHLLGKAVDLGPYPLDWNDRAGFEEIKRAMFQAADELGVKIRWGSDWNQNGIPYEKGEYDSPHFELV